MSGERIVVTVDRELEPLIPTFLANRRADVERIRALVAKHDHLELVGVGHNLRGCGGPYGFTQVSVIGAAIEAAATTANLQAVDECAALLEDFLQRVEVVFA